MTTAAGSFSLRAPSSPFRPLLSGPASAIAAALAWLGRHGTQGFALSIFLGLALPQFASAARPVLPITIFCFKTVVFLRADLGVIAGLVRRPGKLALACLWLLAAPVVVVGAALFGLGREAFEPGLLLGLAILAAAPPIMSSPAIAILYGFEPSLIIASVILTTVLSPLISPVLVELLAGAAVPLDRSVLALRLLVFIGGAMAVATGLRLWLGNARIRAMKPNLDGFGVLMYFVFAIAAMDGVTRAALDQPARVALFLACAFAVSIAGLGFAMLLLRRLPAAEAFIIGYGSGQRNMGLIVAALGAGMPPSTFLFFALAQFPIYLLPWLLGGIAARIRRADEAAAAG